MLVRPPGVYEVQDDTSLLIRALQQRRMAGRSVLDVGSGTGALAIEAARAGAGSVTAVDLSARSALASWVNSRVHGVSVRVRRGDLFEPVAEHRFDLVLSNPPYVPANANVPSRHRKARCWDAGPRGRVLLERICAEARSVLANGGALLLVQSRISGADETLRALVQNGLSPTIVDRGRVPFGPVLRARASALRARGLLGQEETEEELVVIEARNE